MNKLIFSILFITTLGACGSKNQLIVSGEVVVKHEISINMDEWRAYFLKVCYAQGLNTQDATLCADEKLQEFLKDLGL